MIDSAGMKVSAKSFQLANRAIDFAMSSVAVADPLVPFAMTWRDDESFIERFLTAAYDDSIEMAMRYISDRGDGVSGYAVVWNGYVEIDGRKREAIVAEVGDRHSQHSIQVAQPYFEGRDGAMAADGELLAIGESDNLLQVKLSTETLDHHLLKPAYVTTDSLMHAVTDQAFAQMPIALICMAANLFDGQETEHVVQGIRKLQAIEADRSVAISHHVFGMLAAAVADGDLMNVLPTDELRDMAEIVIAGGNQLAEAVGHGLLSAHDAQFYLAAVKAILEATLYEEGRSQMCESGQKLMRLLDQAS